MHAAREERKGREEYSLLGTSGKMDARFEGQ